MIKNYKVKINLIRRQLMYWLLGIIVIFSSPIFAQKHLDEAFQGSYRKDPKTSIVRSLATDHISRAHKFKTLDDLLIFLPKDVAIRNKYNSLQIHVGKDGPERRVREELFNVEVACWVHAIKWEGGTGDRDFHMIVGNTPDTATATFMNVEVSGLPATESKNYEPLRNVRKQFLDLFSDYTFSASFKQIDPPRKVKIKGSLFFDGDHNHSCGRCPGPSYAKPGTVWEIHPIYSIVEVE